MTNGQFAVSNPATGQELARVPNMGKEETESAIAAAKKAFHTFAEMTAFERAAIIGRFAELLTQHSVPLAALLTAEQGKPLAEARRELEVSAETFRYMAAQGLRETGRALPSRRRDLYVFERRVPLGVVGAITPWNFPIAMLARKIAPALAAGCTVVVKPAEDTPLSTLEVAALAERAGFPAGTLNVVTGDRNQAPEIGDALLSSRDVAKVSLTGSTEVGRKLIRKSADTIKKLSLELGGNAPFIVFASADLDLALKGLLLNKFYNAGQSCIAANRIYVEAPIYDAFAARLADAASAIRVGPGDDSSSQMGPLINRGAVEKVLRHINDALTQGAVLLCGDVQSDSLFVRPTVLTNMTPDMRVKREETFGPLAALFRFSSEDEVLREANDSNMGLAAYFYSGDLAQQTRVARRLEYGMVGINEPYISGEFIPFCSLKESGIGIENGPNAVDEYLTPRIFCARTSELQGL